MIAMARWNVIEPSVLIQRGIAILTYSVYVERKELRGRWYDEIDI